MAQTFAQALGLLFFPVAFGGVLVVVILQLRLYRAYVARYGDRRRTWQRWLGFRPDGSLVDNRFFLTRYDDPLVERRRRQFLLAFGLMFSFVALAALSDLLSR